MDYVTYGDKTLGNFSVYEGDLVKAFIVVRLVKLATSAKTEAITYGNLSALIEAEVGLCVDCHVELPLFLDDMNQDLANVGKPMLSALVVNEQTQMPGSGFWECAKLIEKFEDPVDPADMEDAKSEFWIEEFAKVRAYNW